MMQLPRLIFAFALPVVPVLFWLGCSDDDKGTDPRNHAPVILSVVADPDTIFDDGSTTVVTVTAEDADDDPLTYTWGQSATLRFAGGQGNARIFQSCCDVGDPEIAAVFVTVKDGRGGEDHDSVRVCILPRGGFF